MDDVSLVVNPPVKIAGMNKCDNARIIRDELCEASLMLKDCSLNLIPPANMLNPRTSSKFPIMAPVRLALTTSYRPSRTKKKAMINSAAFPNVALRKPPFGLLHSEQHFLLLFLEIQPQKRWRYMQLRIACCIKVHVMRDTGCYERN